MAEKLETVRFPVMVYDYLKGERDAFNKTRKQGQKLSLANFVRLKYDELKGYQTASMAQPVSVEEKPSETKETKPAESPAENKGVDTMADCPNCTAREIEMQRVKNEVIPALKADSEKTVKQLNDQIADLNKKLAEKPAPVTAHDIPEDLEAVIEHCESGKCPAHAQQWEVLKKRIVDANAPTIVQHTLENLPDTVVESEGLKRGFIPKRITIPVRSR
jgi:hypothetical protein